MIENTPTCLNCRHYDEGGCDNHKLFTSDIEVSNNDGVWFDDPWSGVCVGPNFGCIHFKQTEQVKDK